MPELAPVVLRPRGTARTHTRRHAHIVHTHIELQRLGDLHRIDRSRSQLGLPLGELRDVRGVEGSHLALKDGRGDDGAGTHHQVLFGSKDAQPDLGAGDDRGSRGLQEG